MTKLTKHAHGNAHFSAKLTDDAVREIRKLFNAEQGCVLCGGKPTYKNVGKRFGVSAVAIFKAVKRQSWGHVE